MSTYTLQASVIKDELGRWSAWIDVLPGCNAWGYTREEALRGLEDSALAYIEDMIDAGEDVSSIDTRVVEEVALTVTL
jgi:predicted RNase H-like HicB family nuclease